ncbi:MAG: cation transporter [Magnetococcales bacterium]|nr:cation transporter [Magnetococcales bacterium]
MSESSLNVKDQEYAEAKRVTQVGTVWDFLLTVGKIVIGLLTHSAALIAEGFHSLADLLFDLVVLLGMKIARKEPDASHPYGHGKFEGMAAMLLAVILFGVAVGIVMDATKRMQMGNLEAPGQLAFWMALGSILVKELLFQYTIRTGRRLKSNIMIANAWHHRADSISSLAALVGIGGALLGWPIMDPVSAIAVAFFVSKVAFEVAQTALRELTDARGSIDEPVREKIMEIVARHPQVRNAHTVRARRFGPDILVDLHLAVDNHLTVSEGHQISAEVSSQLHKEVQNVREVSVHIDVVDDWLNRDDTEVAPQPGRDQLLAAIQPAIPPDGPILKVCTLMPHYTATEGTLVELMLKPNPDYSRARIYEAAKELTEKLLAADLGVRKVRAFLLVATAPEEEAEEGERLFK